MAIGDVTTGHYASVRTLTATRRLTPDAFPDVWPAAAARLGAPA
jgi:hypothetical protein